MKLNCKQSITVRIEKIGIMSYRRLRKGDSAEQKQARRLKRYWRLFLQDRENLSTKVYYEGCYFNRVVNSIMILDLILAYDQELRATYNFIQSLKHAYNQRDFTTFFQLLKLRPDSVSHYTIHRCQALARYKEGIKRGFETKFSNGRTEGINNRIKTIKRVACGYRYFTAFKTRIYLIIGHQIQTN